MERALNQPESLRICPDCRDSITYCMCEKQRGCPFCGDEECENGECAEEYRELNVDLEIERESDQTKNR